MVDAKTLFHKADPDTSKEAAEDMVKSGRLSRQERLVLITIEDVCAALGKKDFTPKEIVRWDSRFSYHIIQRRLSGLHNKGKIERIQIEGIKTHPAGNPVYKKRDGCCVWRIV